VVGDVTIGDHRDAISGELERPAITAITVCHPRAKSSR